MGTRTCTCHSPETEIGSLSRWRKQSIGIARGLGRRGRENTKLLGFPLMMQHQRG